MESKKLEERNHMTWLEGMKQNKQYQRAYAYFEEFLEDKDESWIMDNLTTEDWGQHLCDFRDYLSQTPKTRGEGFLSDNTTKTLAGAIRGYLKHIGAPLKLTKRQSEYLLKVESLVSIDFPFNINIKGSLLGVSDPIEEYIVAVGVSFGLRINDFLTITRGQLEPLLVEDAPIPLGKLQTQKKGEAAYPFISGDAKQAIERLLKDMDAMGKTDKNEPMLRKDANQINKILKDLFNKANINVGSYTVRFHILRKFLSDNLATVSSSDKWKLIVGKSAKSPYIASDCLETYKRAMPLIDCNGERYRGKDKQVENLRITIKQQEHDIIALKTRLESLQQTTINNSKAIGEILSIVKKEKPS